MVLHNANLGIWLLLNYNGGSEGNVNITIARSAFTGGSTTAKPTATNETSIGTSTVASAVAVMSAESIFGVTYRFGISISESGAFHVYANRVSTGVVFCWLGVLQLFNQSVGDGWPVVGSIHATTSGRGAPAIGTIGSTASLALRYPNNSARCAQGGFVTWSFGGTTFEGSALADVLTGQWAALPIYCRNNDAANAAWRGNLQDCYVVGVPAVGASWPTVGTQQMFVVGNLLIPGAVPLAL